MDLLLDRASHVCNVEEVFPGWFVVVLLRRCSARPASHAAPRPQPKCQAMT